MIADFHNDTILKLKLYDTSLGSDDSLHINIKKLKESEVSTLFFAMLSSPFLTPTESRDYVKSLIQMLKESPAPIRVSSSFSDQIAGAVNAFIAVEGGYLLENDPEKVSFLVENNIKLLTLTHFAATPWAGSSSENNELGLNSVGHSIVKELNRSKIIVDVAHGSTKTIMDAAKTSDLPVVYSHGGARHFNGITRGIEDKAIKALADTAGVIGISFFPLHVEGVKNYSTSELDALVDRLKDIEDDSSLSSKDKFTIHTKVSLEEYPRPTHYCGVEEVFKQIDYIVKLVGDDHVCFGSDFDGIPYSSKGLSDITSLKTFGQFMETKRYTPERVQKILGGNIQRVMKAYS